MFFLLLAASFDRQRLMEVIVCFGMGVYSTTSTDEIVSTAETTDSLQAGVGFAIVKVIKNSHLNHFDA